MLEYLAAKGVILPFMVMRGATHGLDMQRVAESLLVAVVTAVATMYGTQKVIENEIGHLRDGQLRIAAIQAEMQTKVNTAFLRQELLIPLREEQMRAFNERIKKLERGRM